MKRLVREGETMSLAARRLLARGVLGLVIFGAAARLSAEQDRFACTEVLGFSQSWEWFTGRALSERRGNVDVPAQVFLNAWQGRFEFGAAVELWSDPGFHGWDGTYLSPQMCARNAVDRIIFNVSGASREVQQWAHDIVEVLDVLREKYPAVRRIVLQPVVGAEPGQCGDVRAAQNHPLLVSAIASVAAADRNPQIIAGPAPTVANCDHFTDLLGHLSPSGAQYVHELLRNQYSERFGR